MASLSNLKEIPSLSSPTSAGQRYNYISELDQYPIINLKNELINPSANRITIGHSFIPVETESVPKRISRTFFDGGFWESLAEARSEKTREQAPLISKTADSIAYLLDLYNKIKLKVFPHTQQLSAERIAQYAETRFDILLFNLKHIYLIILMDKHFQRLDKQFCALHCVACSSFQASRSRRG